MKIIYDQKQNIFYLDGLWEKPLPFTLNINYTVNLPVNQIPQASGSPFKSQKNGWSAATPELGFKLLWQVIGAGIEINIHIKNQTNRNITLHNINPSVIELEEYKSHLDRMTFYQHGFQSKTPSGPVSATGLQQYPRIKSLALQSQNVDSPFWGRRDGIISSLFTVISGDASPGDFLIGFTGSDKGLGEIFLRNRGLTQLISFLDYGGKTLSPGDKLVTEPLWIGCGDPDELIEFYTSRLGLNMAARVAESSLVGWCPRYEFDLNSNGQSSLDNLRQLSPNPESGNVIVQLDVSKQEVVQGRFSLNKEFSDELENFTRVIHERGFQAGISMAPFVAAKNSKMYQDNPDWFLKDDKGKPVDCGLKPRWKTRAVALDLTHPEVEKWLHDLFQKLVEIGFDFFKIDFIFAGARSGQRNNFSLSPVETYRYGLKIIRKAIGKRFLVGCGAPIGPSIGYVDALQVSEDLKEEWDSPFREWLGKKCDVSGAKGSLRNSIQRQYFHKKMWLNDPGSLPVWDKKSRLSPTEMRTMTSLLGMTGGMLFLGGDLARLNLDRLEWIKAVLPITNLSGKPINQFARKYPDVFMLTGEKSQVIAITNWQNKPQKYDLSNLIGSDIFMFDFWGEIFWSPVVAKLAAHATLVCQVSNPTNYPQVVGTNLHLAGLADGRIIQEYNNDLAILTVTGERLARYNGKLWLAIPEGYSYFGAEMNGKMLTIESWEEGVIITVDKPVSWKLKIKFLNVN